MKAFLLLPALLGLTEASLIVKEALQGDDQCAAEGSDCALNALQIRGKALTPDLSTKAKDKLQAELLAFQPKILAVYNNLSALDKTANETIAKIETALGGEKVKWDHGNGKRTSKGANLLQEKASEASSMPPNAKAVQDIVNYYNKEFKAIWALDLLVVRKRFGIWNTLLAHPDGPNGQGKGGGNDHTDPDDDDDDAVTPPAKPKAKTTESSEGSGDDSTAATKSGDDSTDGSLAQLQGSIASSFSDFEIVFEQDIRKIQLEILDAQNKTASVSYLMNMTVNRTEEWLKGGDVYDIPVS